MLYCRDVMYTSPPSDPLARKTEETNDNTQKPLRGVLELPEGIFAKAQKGIQNIFHRIAIST